MSVEQFFVETVVILHVTTHDQWGAPYVETVFSMGRVEAAKTLYVTAGEDSRTTLAKLFTFHAAVTAADDLVMVGGVVYKVKRSTVVRNKWGVPSHTECELGAGRENDV